jgi:hypothetical protein
MLAENAHDGDSTELLNQLLWLHFRSLPAYLIDAMPYVAQGDEPLERVLREIATEQAAMGNRLADAMVERGNLPEFGTFPMEFTGLHDLSVEYLLSEVVRRQARLSADVLSIASRIGSGSYARDLVLAAADQAQKHLQRVRSLAESLHGKP